MTFQTGDVGAKNQQTTTTTTEQNATNQTGLLSTPRAGRATTMPSLRNDKSFEVRIAPAGANDDFRLPLIRIDESESDRQAIEDVVQNVPDTHERTRVLGIGANRHKWAAAKKGAWAGFKMGGKVGAAIGSVLGGGAALLMIWGVVPFVCPYVAVAIVGAVLVGAIGVGIIGALGGTIVGAVRSYRAASPGTTLRQDARNALLTLKSEGRISRDDLTRLQTIGSERWKAMLDVPHDADYHARLQIGAGTIYSAARLMDPSAERRDHMVDRTRAAYEDLAMEFDESGHVSQTGTVADGGQRLWDTYWELPKQALVKAWRNDQASSGGTTSRDLDQTVRTLYQPLPGQLKLLDENSGYYSVNTNRTASISQKTDVLSDDDKGQDEQKDKIDDDDDEDGLVFMEEESSHMRGRDIEVGGGRGGSDFETQEAGLNLDIKEDYNWVGLYKPSMFKIKFDWPKQPEEPDTTKEVPYDGIRTFFKDKVEDDSMFAWKFGDALKDIDYKLLGQEARALETKSEWWQPQLEDNQSAPRLTGADTNALRIAGAFDELSPESALQAAISGFSTVQGSRSVGSGDDVDGRNVGLYLGLVKSWAQRAQDEGWDKTDLAAKLKAACKQAVGPLSSSSNMEATFQILRDAIAGLYVAQRRIARREGSSLAPIMQAHFEVADAVLGAIHDATREACNVFRQTSYSALTESIDGALEKSTTRPSISEAGDLANVLRDALLPKVDAAEVLRAEAQMQRILPLARPNV